MRKKKSQMEVMGLAIVVILLALSMIFVVRFVVLKKPAEFKKAFTQTELASNMLNTFLKTTSEDCNGLSMTELLQDCARGPTITCVSGTFSSCQYVTNTASSIFSDTLDSWNVDYSFTVYQELSPSTLVIERGTACRGAKKSKTFVMPTTPGNPLIIKLDICG